MGTQIHWINNKNTKMTDRWGNEWRYDPRWSCRFEMMIQPGDVFGLTSMSEDRTTRLTIPPIYDQIAVSVKNRNSGSASASGVRNVLLSEGCLLPNIKIYESEKPLYHRSKSTIANNVRIDIAFQIDINNWDRYSKEYKLIH